VPWGKRKDGKAAEGKKCLNYGSIQSNSYKEEASWCKHKWVFPYLAMYKGTQMTSQDAHESPDTNGDMAVLSWGTIFCYFCTLLGPIFHFLQSKQEAACGLQAASCYSLIPRYCGLP